MKPVGLQSYLRIEGGTTGARVLGGSSHTECEEVLLES